MTAGSDKKEQAKLATGDGSTKAAWRSLALGESLDISGAEKLRNRLQKALAAGRPVRLDTAKLSRIDTAALQLLVAFVREMRANGFDVAWRQPGAALYEAAQLLGLGEALALPAVGMEASS